MREVARVSWNWRQDSVGSDERQHSSLRRSAALQAVGMVLVGAVLTWVLHHGLAGRIIWSLAGVLFLLGMAWPGGYRPVHAFGQWIGRGVGGLLLYLLLAPFFLLFFFPVGLILRLRKRDPLQRFPHAPGHTYWIARPAKDRGTNIADQFLREDRDARVERRPVGTSTWTGHEEKA